MSTVHPDTAQNSGVSSTNLPPDNCACPDPVNDNTVKPAKRLRNIFKKCAMCAGSGAGGFLAGHAGCILAPLVVVAAGATTATAGLPLIAVAFSSAVTAGGLYVWHRLRGHKAGKWEKRIVIGSALTGVLLSSVFHFSSSKHSHSDTPAQTPTTDVRPAEHIHHH